MSDMLAELADDVGTTYVLMGAPVEMSGTVARSHLAFIPAVPAAATELRLSISKLFSLGNVETTPGPWEFIVPLPRRNS
jgi:hypothetical protein